MLFILALVGTDPQTIPLDFGENLVRDNSGGRYEKRIDASTNLRIDAFIYYCYFCCIDI